MCLLSVTDVYSSWGLAAMLDDVTVRVCEDRWLRGQGGHQSCAGGGEASSWGPPWQWLSEHLPVEEVVYSNVRWQIVGGGSVLEHSLAAKMDVMVLCALCSSSNRICELQSLLAADMAIGDIVRQCTCTHDSSRCFLLLALLAAKMGTMVAFCHWLTKWPPAIPTANMVVVCINHTFNNSVTGATVAERLALSPPTKANRAQSPAGSPDFRKWESRRTMPLVGGSSRGSPVSPPPPNSGTAPIFPSITLIGSQDLAVKSRPNLFTHSLTSVTATTPSLRCVQMPTSPWKAVLEAVQHLERGRGCTLPEVVRYLKRQEPTKTSRKTLAWCVRTQPLVPEDGRAARGGIAQLPCVSARRGKSHRRRPISRRRASRKPARCSSRKHARRSSRSGSLLLHCRTPRHSRVYAVHCHDRLYLLISCKMCLAHKLVQEIFVQGRHLWRKFGSHLASKCGGKVVCIMLCQKCKRLVLLDERKKRTGREKRKCKRRQE
ncbi:hypothetical protein PR048_007645 [Dryococelus australis]|uniref:Uncharacterized protein n=1 Tax=Dryococelus australis TaxID=614101 RepID=A0ABQ9HWG9_9NEOP|nr:hypothetical protein PR048_007645 [Dryococelus australis]